MFLESRLSPDFWELLKKGAFSFLSLIAVNMDGMVSIWRGAIASMSSGKSSK